MFTGIIEHQATIVSLKKKDGNLYISLRSNITQELKIDQSVSHNGACLTVVDIRDDIYDVVAIKETLDKSNLESLQKGDLVNLERSLKLGDRLDGHLVQGHVDQTAKCIDVVELKGSRIYTFEYADQGNFTVEKGSICINGVSLTVLDSMQNSFSVAIIPYTLENTNFNKIEIGVIVNLEFDVLGKYLAQMNKAR